MLVWLALLVWVLEFRDTNILYFTTCTTFAWQTIGTLPSFLIQMILFSSITNLTSRHRITHQTSFQITKLTRSPTTPHMTKIILALITIEAVQSVHSTVVASRRYLWTWCTSSSLAEIALFTCLAGKLIWGDRWVWWIGGVGWVSWICGISGIIFERTIAALRTPWIYRCTGLTTIVHKIIKIPNIT